MAEAAENQQQPPQPQVVKNVVLMAMDPMELAYAFSCMQLAESKLLTCPHAELLAMNAVMLSASMLGRRGVVSMLERMNAGAKAIATTGATA